MVETVGYMITWTTYGAWLQGREEGFVKDGKVRGENIAMKRDCEVKVKGSPVRLRGKEKEIVRQAIVEAAKRFKQKILAVAAHSNHVHIVAEYVDRPIGVLAGYYKNAARVALQRQGFEGRVWTRGYDKRYCFDEKSLRARVDYVRKHKS